MEERIAKVKELTSHLVQDGWEINHSYYMTRMTKGETVVIVTPFRINVPYGDKSKCFENADDESMIDTFNRAMMLTNAS